MHNQRRTVQQAAWLRAAEPAFDDVIKTGSS